MTVCLPTLRDELQSAVTVLQDNEPLSARCKAAADVIGACVDFGLDHWEIAHLALRKRTEVAEILLLAHKGLKLLAQHRDAMLIEFGRPEETLHLARKRMHRICLVCEIHPTEL